MSSTFNVFKYFHWSVWILFFTKFFINFVIFLPKGFAIQFFLSYWKQINFFKIEEETLKFAKKLGIRTVAVIGGVSNLLKFCDKICLRHWCPYYQLVCPILLFWNLTRSTGSFIWIIHIVLIMHRDLSFSDCHFLIFFYWK